MGMDDHNAIDLRENALFLPASCSLAAEAIVPENYRSAPAFTPQRAGVQVNLQDEMWSQILAKLA